MLPIDQPLVNMRWELVYFILLHRSVCFRWGCVSVVWLNSQTTFWQFLWYWYLKNVIMYQKVNWTVSSAYSDILNNLQGVPADFSTRCMKAVSHCFPPVNPGIACYDSLRSRLFVSDEWLYLDVSTERPLTRRPLVLDGDSEQTKTPTQQNSERKHILCRRYKTNNI